MSASGDGNFAALIISRLTARSDLIDAATGEIITSAELPARVAAAAAAFRSYGLMPADRILISCRVSPQSSIAYLGALLAGLVAVPISEQQLASSGAGLSRTIHARALWTQNKTHFEWARQSLLHITGEFAPVTQSTPAAAAPRSEDDLAALMPTSGSTGAPRLVRVTHGNLIANTQAIARSQRLGEDERAMLILPISYCFGASVLHTHLYCGGSAVYDSRFMFPDKVLRSIERYHCTTFAGVPTAYQILLRRSNLATISMPSLRRFLQAGGSLPTEKVEQMKQLLPQVEFFVMYGQTEATARISCLPPDSLLSKRGSVGLPMDNLEVRVVDDNGHEVSGDQTGEIWVSGKSICSGYEGDPEETARKFRGGWLATGDIGRRDADGYLWIVGRRSEFIKMRGIRISLAEVESRIAVSPGVSECAAAVVEHPEAGEALALYVVAKQGARDVESCVRRHIPREWVCDSVTLLDALPRNHLGKLVRSDLRRPQAEAG